MTTEPDASAVIDRLQHHYDRMTEIMDLIGDKRRVTSVEKSHLHHLLTVLKSELRADVKRGSTARGEASLNDIERAYLMPAVRQANAGIHVATNSDPIRSNWHATMYGAQIEIDFPLRSLLEQYPRSND